MQTISIFVSSTFKDMMYERDILRRYVWPELSNYYNPKGIDVQLIDLRWGVVAEEDAVEESEKKILKCCIDTIDVCKPFVIGFIGHRYGWIPPKDNNYRSKILGKHIPLSVTHIEMDYGISQSNNYSRSLIFKRNPDSYKSVPTNEMKTYVDSDKELVDYAYQQFDILRKGYENANALDNIIDYSLDIFKASDGINDEEAETFLFKKISVLVHLIVDYGTEEGIVSDLKQTINESKSFVERIGEKLQDHNKQVWKTINSAFPT